MNGEERISNLKLLYVDEYIQSILNKNSIYDLQNNKYALVVTLYYYSEQFGFSKKKAIDLIYSIARYDEIIKKAFQRKEMK